MGEHLGIIDSLSAGYRFLGYRFSLLLVPVLLDLFLWVGPRLSVAPLLDRVANFYANAGTVEGMPAEMVDLSAEFSRILGEFSAGYNLMEFLVNSSMLHVPSIMVMTGPMPGAALIQISSVGVAFMVAIVLVAIGLLLGVFYMSLVARHLPIGHGPNTMTWPEFASSVFRNWLLLILLVVLLALFLVALYIPVSVGIALVALVSPAFSSTLALFLGLLSALILFFLYFVPVGLIMDSLPLRTAVVQSVQLVRGRFVTTLGFFLLTSLIMVGVGLILSNIAAFAPWGTISAILLSAYLGTGLVMALMVFYRSQLLRLSEEVALMNRRP